MKCIRTMCVCIYSPYRHGYIQCVVIHWLMVGWLVYEHWRCGSAKSGRYLPRTNLVSNIIGYTLCKYEIEIVYSWITFWRRIRRTYILQSLLVFLVAATFTASQVIEIVCDSYYEWWGIKYIKYHKDHTLNHQHWLNTVREREITQNYK